MSSMLTFELALQQLRAASALSTGGKLALALADDRRRIGGDSLSAYFEYSSSLLRAPAQSIASQAVMNLSGSDSILSQLLEGSIRSKVDYQSYLYNQVLHMPSLPPSVSIPVNLPTSALTRIARPVPVKPHPKPTAHAAPSVVDKAVERRGAKLTKQKKKIIQDDEHAQMSKDQKSCPIKKVSEHRHDPIAAAFPAKLFHLIERAEAEDIDDIISFLPGGKAFQIHEANRFAEEVLPLFSKSTRFPSFLKQLNLYGFKRGPSSMGNHVYCHPFFQRDSKRLLAKIQRPRMPPPERSAHVTPAAHAAGSVLLEEQRRQVGGGDQRATRNYRGTDIVREKVILADALRAAGLLFY